jgi:lysophospholipase L1-like esterase
MHESSSGKRPGANLLLLAITVLVVLAIAEGALAVFYPIDYLKVPERMPGNMFREILHRPSEVPGLAFELSPNRQKKYESVWVRTNNFGMRDTEPVAGDAVFRIVALGDSFTFGFRVDGDATYPSVLEARLNEGASDMRFDVLNMGVSGYNTRDEALVLEHKGLSWNPDLVVVGYVLNDPEIGPVQPLTSYFQDPAIWQHFHLARLMVSVKHGLDVRLRGGGDYYRYLHADGHKQWESVVGAFADIHQMTAEQQIPVLVVIFPERPEKRWGSYLYEDLHQQVAEAARANEFAVIDLLPRFKKHRARRMRVRQSDSHPSDWGHSVAADAIYQWMTAELLESSQSESQPEPAS